MDPFLLRRMREAGFAFVLIGFETGSERIMTLIKKGETVQQISEGVRHAKDAGFTVGGQFILGFPTETATESRQTICHALRLPIDSCGSISWSRIRGPRSSKWRSRPGNR